MSFASIMRRSDHTLHIRKIVSGVPLAKRTAHLTASWWCPRKNVEYLHLTRIHRRFYIATLEKFGEVISTDVLVIGGSLSGAMAAIKAKECDVDVLIVDKATVGWGGQAPMVGGGTFVLTPEDDSNSFVKWLVSYGEYLNDQDWVHSMARDSWNVVKEAMEWGAYLKKGDAPLAVRMPSLQTHYSFAQIIPGNVELPLRAQAQKNGVKMLSKIAAVDLLKQNNRIVGAVGFNLIDGRFYIFKSKATILAAGSCDFKANRLCISSGESIAMAYRAGAELRNAEFNNLYGPVLKEYDIWADGIVDEYFFN